tara:strand:- start:584 stop:793 length:210 start_codon:yes stop_codon:yes gene_type:complete
MMADVWNPFDPKNPVYKRLEKQTRIQSKRIRNTVIVGGILLAGYIASKQGKTHGIFGPPVNQFGMVRRK